MIVSRSLYQLCSVLLTEDLASVDAVRDRDSDWQGPSREGGDGFGVANYKGK